MSVKFRVSAPGKVILHGEHSVVYGKTAVAASLGFRTFTALEENHSPNSTLVIHLTNLGLIKIIFDVDKLSENIPTDIDWQTPQNLDHEAHYGNVKSYFSSYISKCNLKLTDAEQQAFIIILYLYTGILNTRTPSISLEIKSDLAIGAGTGSSASYAVSIAGALLHYLRLKYPNEYYRKVVKDEPSTDFNNVEKDIISNWAFNCEKIAHGTPSGIDNSVCTYGSVIEFRKNNALIPHNLKVQLRIILVNSKVSRQTKVLVKNVSLLRDKFPNLIDTVMDAMDVVALDVLKILESIDADAENIVEKYKDLSLLVDFNHNLLAALQVSHPSLEKIRLRAGECGLKCKLTGAGGGGYAIIFIPPTSDETNVKKLIEILNDDGFDAQSVSLGVSGVQVEASDAENN